MEVYCIARNLFFNSTPFCNKIIDIILSVICFSYGIACRISHAFGFAAGI